MPANPAVHRSALDVSERLWPSLGWWVALCAVGASAGLVQFPLGAVWAIASGALALVVIVVLVVVSTPRIAVEDGVLQAGRAHIGLEHVGEVEVLDRDAWNTAMGPGYDPREFHCTRSWVRQGLRVRIVDPDDPTTAWLISARQPQALRTAISDQRRAGTGR